MEEWDKGIIDYDKNTNQLFHNEGKIFSSDVIAWYEGGRTTEDLVKEYSDEKEVEEDREHQILLLLGHAVHCLLYTSCFLIKILMNSLNMVVL